MSDRAARFTTGFDASIPLASAATIPNDWYTDAAVYEAERQRVFGNAWLAVARAEQLQAPGSFATLDVAGEPILMARDEAGELHAFANVCRHRAAKVACEPCGVATRFRCRYHGWTYDLAGNLRGLPEFDGAVDFAREDHGLPRYQTGIHGPTAFVHLGKPELSLEEFLEPMGRLMPPGKLDGLQFVARREYDLACNWKVYIDNYLDGGYHVNTIHPALAGVLDYTRYRSEIAGETSVQISPLKPPDPQGSNVAVGAVRGGEWAYYWWLFPNFMINVYDGIADTNLVLPLGPDRCRVIFEFFFAKTESDADKRFIADSIAVAHQIQMEDGDICEEVQRGLSSRSYRTGRFSPKREAAGHHFHRLLARQLAS